MLYVVPFPAAAEVPSPDDAETGPAGLDEGYYFDDSNSNGEYNSIGYELDFESGTH